MERFIERMFFASRWLLAPIYFGLSVALIILGIQFFMELFHAFQHVITRKQRTLLPTWLRPVQGTTHPRKPRSCCRCWRWSICRWWRD